MTNRQRGPYEESWEPGIAERIAKAVKENGDGKLPYMVALVGVPGSGKSVSSMILANILEEEKGIPTMVCPHDGYHYPLEYLRTFPDADDVIYRRGAPETFDPRALLRDLDRIKNNSNDETVIQLPAFDHAKGDPEPDKHTFDRTQHKIVICEGLYLLHEGDGWQEVANMFDLKIFMESNVDNCIERLKIRNQCIPGYTPEEIDVRCEKVDRVNAMLVVKSKSRADIVVNSRTRPVRESEKPEEPDATSAALTALTLLAHEQAEAVNETNHEWTMDIIARPRPESVPTLSRTNSFASQKSDRSDAPPPASQFVGSWEPGIAEQIVEKLNGSDHKLPFMVALVGGPGSGKSVSSMLLASILEEKGFPTMVCPHDGYHYPLEYLKTFPNADDVIYRRGAPDTFDPRALLRDLGRIRNGDEELIKLPAFDHATGDPEPDTHIFDRHQHKIVLCEGLYLLHDQDGWEDIASMFDVSVFMNSDVDVCIDCVKIRNLCIPGYTPKEIEERCEKVDRVNALTVLRSKERADVVVDSMAMKKD